MKRIPLAPPWYMYAMVALVASVKFNTILSSSMRDALAGKRLTPVSRLGEARADYGCAGINGRSTDVNAPSTLVAIKCLHGYCSQYMDGRW